MLFNSQDTMFLLNFLYMLDRIFQQFCSELRRHFDEPDPVLAARQNQAYGWMERQIERLMSDWIVLGTVPSLSSPLAWKGKSIEDGVVDISNLKRADSRESSGPRNNRKGGKKAGNAGGGGGAPQGRGQDQPGSKELASDEYVHEWRLPIGKRFNDFFTREHTSNFVGLPLAPHHKTGEPRPLCLRYQIQNGPKCRRGMGCYMTHIRPADIPREDKDTITIRLKQIYSGEQS
jgi:hypothetical protein